MRGSALAVLAVLVGLGGCGTGSRPAESASATSSRAGDSRSRADGERASERDLDLTPEVLYSRTVRSMVVIQTPNALGSGFVVDSQGLVVTNLHVVAGAQAIKLRFADGSELEPTRIEAADPERDLVVLRVDKRMPALSMSPRNKVVLGESVVAIGNPLGLEATISQGLISGVRETPGGTKVLQITAPISSGSSGGPILNLRGEVVGVSTFVLRGGQNIGFGVPVRYLKELLDKKTPMDIADFARATGRPETEAQMPRVRREIPEHDVKILNGCSDRDLAVTIVSIGSAVEIGAPLYNAGNFRACANIYEGAAVDLERKLSKRCAGPRKAIAAGRKRAARDAQDFTRAWALRDTFDGLIDVIARSRGHSRAPR